MSESPSPEALPVIGASMAAFAALAAQGSFTVNPHGGQALLKPIRDLVAWIDRERRVFDRLRQVPMLGSSNNAEVMKPFMQKVAGDEAGFITQLLALRESLIVAEQAVTEAMAHYQEADDQAANQFGER